MSVERDDAIKRAGILAVQLVATELERDGLRRQVDALVAAAQSAPCTYCEARDFCDNREPGLTCPETLLAWSAEVAKEEGAQGEGAEEAAPEFEPCLVVVRSAKKRWK